VADAVTVVRAGRTVAEIAFAWGFADLTTFYRAFRRAYGAAPGELRPARRLCVVQRSLVKAGYVRRRGG